MLMVLMVLMVGGGRGGSCDWNIVKGGWGEGKFLWREKDGTLYGRFLFCFFHTLTRGKKVSIWEMNVVIRERVTDN